MSDWKDKMGSRIPTKSSAKPGTKTLPKVPSKTKLTSTKSAPPAKKLSNGE